MTDKTSWTKPPSRHRYGDSRPAVVLGCSVAAVRKWAYQGRLRRVKVGRLARFQREEVERIAANGLPPTSRDVSGKARQSA